MIVAATQAIRDYKSGSTCCYLPGTIEHHTYWETIEKINAGTLTIKTDNTRIK